MLRFIYLRALTGRVNEQYLFICYGRGGNGKNVLLDTVMQLMGDYACPAPPNLLTQTKSDQHPTEIADLAGQRLVVASESEEGAVLRLQLVKRLTGDAELKGRRMRCNFFKFPRTHKTFLVTNNKPRVREQSRAAWRRLRLIPFLVAIPDQEQDKMLLEKLKEEWPGILAWLVAGCLAWQARGLGEAPSAVVKATGDYRAGEDTIGRFLEQRCVVVGPDSPGAENRFTPWRELYGTYTAWAMSLGETLLSAHDFGEELESRGHPSGIRRVAGKPAKGRAGIALRQEGPGRSE